MTDLTPAPAATPEAQAAEGQQREPEQPYSEPAQLSPEQLRAEVEALRKEAAKWRTQLRQTEKAQADAEAKRLAEQGEYKALYETAAEKAARADALQERLDAITAQTQAANERRIKAIPDAMRGLVPEYDDPLKLAAWLDANAAVFSRPAPPPLDGRAAGSGTTAAVTDDEVRDFAVRMGIRPEHVDRATLAKALKR